MEENRKQGILNMGWGIFMCMKGGISLSPFPVSTFSPPG